MTPEQIEQLKADHSKALEEAQNTIIQLHQGNMVHDADKSALASSVNELLQANVGLRAKLILTERQSHNNMVEKNAQIKDLTNKLDVANKVIEASTNLKAPAKAK